ncbi:MAG: hypothetical protein CL949_12400 [Erythrobacter sp.]|nr:hypothetical protein [Erythrobacter sp.]
MSAPATPQADRSLGDILAACLRAHNPDPKEAQRRAAFEFVRGCAPLIGVSEVEAFDALTYVPDNLLHLLESPQGWSALAGFISADLGIVAPAFRPAIH